MKRFNNIMVLYDFELGADETLQRGVHLALKNNADLTILNVIQDDTYSLDILDERQKLLERLCNNFPITEDNFRIIVKQGDKVDEALTYIDRFDIDLVITPTEIGKGFEKMIGIDTTASLLRGTNCPIWVIRPNSPNLYQTVVVAVNAGKDGALKCDVNRRLLELGYSLAEMENADLRVLYVWDYPQYDKERLTSELHDTTREEIYQNNRYNALNQLVDLTLHVLGEPLKAKPEVRYGDVEDEIEKYLEDTNADILVSEGTPKGPLMDAILGNRGLSILNNTKCNVLISRP